MQYHIVPVTAFEQNCTLLSCPQTRSAAIVDPGGDEEVIFHEVARQELTPECVLLTHGHLDHVGAAQAVADHYGIPIYGPHQEDAFWFDILPMQGRMFGFAPAEKFVPTRWLEHGDNITIGETSVDVIHAPGHTPGHVVFHHAPSQLALVGDVLFQGSIGRTDFPRGDHATLLRSIREQLWPLGRETRFIPGHGPMSTLGQEMDSNPFLD